MLLSNATYFFAAWHLGTCRRWTVNLVPGGEHCWYFMRQTVHIAGEGHLTHGRKGWAGWRWQLVVRWCGRRPHNRKKINGFHQNSKDFNRNSTDFHKIQQIALNFNRFHTNVTFFCKIMLIAAKIHRFLQNSADFINKSADLRKIQRIFVKSGRFQQNPTDFHKHHQNSITEVIIIIPRSPGSP